MPKYNLNKREYNLHSSMKHIERIEQLELEVDAIIAYLEKQKRSCKGKGTKFYLDIY